MNAVECGELAHPVASPVAREGPSSSKPRCIAKLPAGEVMSSKTSWGGAMSKMPGAEMVAPKVAKMSAAKMPAAEAAEMSAAKVATVEAAEMSAAEVATAEAAEMSAAEVATAEAAKVTAAAEVAAAEMSTAAVAEGEGLACDFRQKRRGEADG